MLAVKLKFLLGSLPSITSRSPRAHCQSPVMAACSIAAKTASYFVARFFKPSALMISMGAGADNSSRNRVSMRT